MNSKRAPDFRWIFTNGFLLQMTENEVMLSLGVVEDVAKPDESIHEQIGAVLTPRSAKLLAHILTTIIANWEKANAKEIPLDAKKVEEIAQRMVTGPTARPERKPPST